MAGGSSADNPVGINVTAMVDIIFCLCLFFMCSLKFRELDGKLDSWLPSDVGPGGERTLRLDEPIRIVLSFDSERGVVQRFFERRPIDPAEAGDAALQGLIREEVASRAALGRTDVRVILDSGANVPWQAAVDVMNLAKTLGVHKIEFGCGTPLGN
jgi:biopolymer transport protein ExbD